MANYDVYLNSNSGDQYRQSHGTQTFEVQGENSLGNSVPGGGGNDFFDAANRFPSVPIAQGTTVNAAQLRINAASSQGSGGGNMKFITYGIKEVNTATFSTNPFSRTRTSASTSQSSGEPGLHAFVGINVTSQVNEILAQGSWASGNAMGFLTFDNNSDANNWIYDAGTLSSQLVIQVSAPSSFTPSPVTISAPTFPAATDWGIRVSKPGVDVKTATETQLYFTSRKKELRINTQGETSSTQFAHGLAYAPGVLGYYTDASGRHIINFPFNRFSVGAAILSDSTNIYLSYQNASPEYYYVFIDPLT